MIRPAQLVRCAERGQTCADAVLNHAAAVATLWTHSVRHTYRQNDKQKPRSLYQGALSVVNPYAHKGKGRALDIAPQVDTATTKALRYMARTKQRRTYLPYTFPAIANSRYSFTDPERMEG